MLTAESRTECPRGKDLGTPSSVIHKKSVNMGAPPFFVPKLYRELDYRGQHLQVIEAIPGGYIAVIWNGVSNKVLMNPVRGDHFRHPKQAIVCAKYYMRGKRLKHPQGIHAVPEPKKDGV